MSVYWLDEIESLICIFCLSVAACTFFWADPSLIYTIVLLDHKASNQPRPQEWSLQGDMADEKLGFGLWKGFWFELLINVVQFIVNTANKQEKQAIQKDVVWFTSQRLAGVSHRCICSDSCTCCDTEIEVADQPISSTVYWHQANHSQRWPCNARCLAV